MYVTCKDYNTIRGVATQLNDQAFDGKDIWYVKGPMGLGLDVDKDGHNVVFTGGTGILVFLDIVAMIALQHTAEDYMAEFGPNFKLTLYYTAPSEKEAIGIELC